MSFKPLTRDLAALGLIPQVISKGRCHAAYVGKVYFVCRKRPVNWHFDAVISSRFDNELSFHHSFAAAKSYVEGERVQGTAWTISEIPCLVATNQRASVFIVEINTDPPFSDLDVQYGSKRSLRSIAECWSRYQERIAGKHVGAGSPIYSFTFLHTHNTPEWKCSCGKSRGKYREGWICNFCGDEVDQEETVCGSYPKPCVRPLKNWSSVSIGSQYHLSWFESPRERYSLRPVFNEAGRLTTHLG
jgi:hypothetical protein